MTELHPRVDVLRGELDDALVGAADGQATRAFVVLALTRGDGTTGIGEASPLPGYSPDTVEAVSAELAELAEGPVHADPLASPFEILQHAAAAHPLATPAARFAIETALLDWLGHERHRPVHEVVGGNDERRPIPIADLIVERDPAAWPSAADAQVADGATHLKLKVGGDLASEVAALVEIRKRHPSVHLRLDGNRRIPLEALRRHADAFVSIGLELFEEPVASEDWPATLELPLPWALDETLRAHDQRRRLLDTGRVAAVVLKPTVLGGFRASIGVAEEAAERGSASLVSHTFDGPIARAAAAELALALQTPLAAGLGSHPALALWSPCTTASIDGRSIVPHSSPGLGLRFDTQDGDDV